MVKTFKFMLSVLLAFSIALVGCNNNDQDQPADNNDMGVENNNGVNNNDNNNTGDNIGEDVDNGLDNAQDEVDDLINGNDDDTDR